MIAKLKGIEGLYSVGECGVVDLESYEEHVNAVENKKYNQFDKKELFWSIYDRIILPSRESVPNKPDNTLRLLYIEENGDTFVFHYNIDSCDESYLEVKGAAEMSFDELLSAVYEDFCNMAKALPDDEPLKNGIKYDRTRNVVIPENYLERLKKDVFYSSWVIETSN